jgi:RHS repeat-associated protein
MSFRSLVAVSFWRREGENLGPSYYRARYYDPSTGRFNSEDPLTFGGGADFYTYVGNGPVNWVDPVGLAQCSYSISRHTLTCVANSQPLLWPQRVVQVGPTDVSSGDNDGGTQCKDNPNCSGRKYKGHGPIEAGEYKMNPDPRPGHEGQYRLEPEPPIIKWYREWLPGWVPGSQRGGFRLHLGSRTHGCINVLYDDPVARAQYLAMQLLLDSEEGNNWLLVTP